MNNTEDRVIEIVSRELKNSSNSGQPISVTPESAMRNPEEWDSLNFVRILTAICEEFNLDIDDEDAVHFTSVKEITKFIDSLKLDNAF